MVSIIIFIVQAVTVIALFGPAAYFLTLLAGTVGGVATYVCARRRADGLTTVIATGVVGTIAAAVMGTFLPFVTSIALGYALLGAFVVGNRLVAN